MILSEIQKTGDIRKIDPDDYYILAEEIREFLIDTVAAHGGHLSSNLGVVELTMALHIAFDLPTDKLIYDVGHQCYTHKILTGRIDEFSTLREHDGLSGFPKRCESETDIFDTGHSSSSISMGLGLACARDLKGEKNKVVAVIGDGALTGGMAFEALNNAAKLNSNFIIVLNDNEMSISHNVGGLSTYLEGIRTTDSYQQMKENIFESLDKIPVYGKRMNARLEKTKNSIKQLIIPGMLFEDMGLTYLGPIDGHDIEHMVSTFRKASRVKGPVLVHVITKKGRGYLPAERHPDRYHGTGAFDVVSGESLSAESGEAYTDIFSKVICHEAASNDKIVAITAAMESGTGLLDFHRQFPKRFFDVGIAEGHAVTFAAALATQDFIPVCAIYSSFLQRAYDQILEDVCLQKLHVIFAIDRAGIVGADGQTHQGMFDLSYLCSMPEMTVMAPMNKWELSDMFRAAIDMEGPVAIRYPRGEATASYKEYRSAITCGKGIMLKNGRDFAILALGSMVEEAMRASDELSKQGIEAAVYNMRFAKPIDTDLLDGVATRFTRIITIEEGVRNGGMGMMIKDYVASHYPWISVSILAAPDNFIEQGSIRELRSIYGMDKDAIIREII